MLTNTYRLSMEPGVPDLNVYISQYDVGKTLVFTLVNTATSASISSGVSVEIRGTKPDGHGFSYNQSSVISYSYSNSTATVTVHVQEQMTAVAGKVVCEIILYKGTPATTDTPASSGYQQLGTANFYLNVERAALDKDTIRSNSSIRQLIDVVDRTDELLEAAEDIQEAYRDYTSALSSKVSINQGVANAGKILVVGNDGIVTLNKETGISEFVKRALLDLIQHVAYIDDQGQSYYDALYAALYPSAYPRIGATFDPGSNTIYVDEGLPALKQYTVVKVYEDADDPGTVIASTDYTLTGTLVDGENTVVVGYDGMVTSVQVEAVDFYNVMHWNSADNPEIVFAAGLISTAKYHSDTKNTAELAPYSTSSPRLTMCANRGACPFLDTSEEETEYYPIPIPANATSVRVTWPDTTYKISVQQKKYQDQYIFGWVADSGWLTGGSYETGIVTSQTRGKADCLLLFVQKGSDQPIIGDTPTIDIQFI